MRKLVVMRSLVRLSSWIHPYRKWVLVSIISMLAASILDLAVPWLIKWAIDSALIQGFGALLLPLAIGIVALVAVKGVFLFWQRYAAAHMAQGVIYDLRNDLYRHLQSLSFSYYDRTQTGQIMSRVTQDVETLRMFLGFGLILLVRNALMLFGIIAFLLVLHWKLAMAVIATIPFLLTAVHGFSTRVRPAYGEIQEQLGRLTATLQENVAGVRVVRIFSREAHEIEKFRRANWNYLEKQIKAVRMWAFYFPLMNFVSGLGAVVVLWYGGREVILGNLSLGSLIAFNQLLVMFLNPLRMLGWLTNLAGRTVASLDRVLEIMDAVPEIADSPNAREMPEVVGHVTFDKVSFSYDGNRGPLVLKEVDLDLKPGSLVALLGSSGSGKSTIVNLIPRFYDPTSGRVCIDGIDLRDVRLESLRRQIGIVVQEPFLFSATVAENIAFGRPGASRAEIEAAARTARIHDFITSLPQGYETQVGERGVRLSGGQKQRISIARTLLLEPRILILDDSTSSVDAETEGLIQEALVDLMRGRTSFVITHRLFTVKRADLIVVLENGCIVQKGTHRELLSAPGPYREIYELQLRHQETLVPTGETL